MRKFGLIAAAAIVLAMLPLGAAAATRSAGDSTPGAKTRAHWFAGSVTAVGSDSLSLGVLWTGPKDGQLNGQTVTVAVDSDTKIVNGKDRSPAQLSDLKAGDLVSLRATSSDSTLASLTATHIRIWCNCHWIGGTISALGTTSLNVQVVRSGPYDTVLKGTNVTIQVSSSTAYAKGKDKTPIAFSDLKVGDGVGVIFGADGFFKAPGFDPSKATFTAKRVHDWQKQQVPPPSSDAGAAAGTTP
ncbi:MAG: DUF5666 domain-containing protein [Gaiellaceae bacterium]|jgi:hypothetical protein